MAAAAPAALRRIAALKREAAELKKAQRIKHHQALRAIAQREGFDSWEALLADADEDAQPSEAQVRAAERRALERGQ